MKRTRPIDRHASFRALSRTAVVFVLLLLASAAFPASLDDYRSRVTSARKAADGLYAMLKGEQSGAEIDRYFARTVGEIQRELPRTEKVELSGGEVEVSNKWLWSRLDEFEASHDRQQQTEIMLEIYERLFAIEDRLSGIAKPSTHSKDEDKRKLAEILGREEYQKPPERQESLAARWLREFLEWLYGIFPKPSVPQTEIPAAGSLPTILQILVYAGVIAMIGYAVYRFAPFFARKMKRDRDDEKGDRVILGEKIDADRSAGDLMAEAEGMARDGDIRGAIRKGYMAFLCELHDRKAISLARNKTNRDFLRDVRKRPGLFERMKRLTGKFERHWYGFRRAEPADWERFREEYNEAIKEV